MLNPQQQQAVRSTEGRILILAGAGSGKTSVLTHRIVYLIDQLKICPSSILGLTFTNKAAEEMRKRVSHMIPIEKAKKLTLCTFHGFCMQVLRKEIERLGYTRQFTLYDEKDVRRLINYLAREELQHEGPLPSLNSTLEQLSIARQKCKSVEKLQTDPLTKKLYAQLQTTLRACNAVDFDHLLYLVVQLFENHKDVLEKYQNKYLYIMIDEYQDTNPVQYQLADLLSQKHQNLCVVGDDDQAIYTWRGADVKNILNFPATLTIKLEQNYRSTSTILGAANQVISHNRERHTKQLWSTLGEGEKIEIFHAPTENDEAQTVVQKLTWYHQQHNIPWNEMAILYRSNLLSRPFEIALLHTSYKNGQFWKKGIPYQIIGGTEFIERSEIKDLIAYLRVVANPLDQEALLRVINVPRRGISDAVLDRLTQINRKENKTLLEVLQNIDSIPDISERAKKGIKNFLAILHESREAFSRLPLIDAIHSLIQSVNYQKAIDEEVKTEKIKNFKWENINAFIQSSRDYSTLTDFIDGLSLEPLNFQRKNPLDEGVNLLTFHSAKGLEFKVCFLVGIEDQIIPHEKSLLEGKLEEERRLFYVALTRAKQFLHLTMARSRIKHGKASSPTPSRFLFEISKDHLKVVHWKHNIL